MQYVLFMPSEPIIREAEFESIAHVPCIFSDEWDYHRAGSYWLIARASGKDLPTKEGGGQIPTRQSLITFARSLIDFLSWCDWAMPQRIDPDTNKPRARWEDVNYNDDLIGR